MKYKQNNNHSILYQINMMDNKHLYSEYNINIYRYN